MIDLKLQLAELKAELPAARRGTAMCWAGGGELSRGLRNSAHTSAFQLWAYKAPLELSKGGGGTLNHRVLLVEPVQLAKLAVCDMELNSAQPVPLFVPVRPSFIFRRLCVSNTLRLGLWSGRSADRKSRWGRPPASSCCSCVVAPALPPTMLTDNVSHNEI